MLPPASFQLSPPISLLVCLDLDEQATSLPHCQKHNLILRSYEEKKRQRKEAEKQRKQEEQQRRREEVRPPAPA